MAETPETPTPSLADQLEAFREATIRPGSHLDITFRVAAAQLRQLDRIKAAYMAVRGEHLATSRPFRADCDNDKCYQLVRDLIEELDALEADDGA